MALPLVPIGLGALNLGSGVYSYINRRRRGQANAQALTGAALETAAGFAIPGGALGKGALGVGGRVVASAAASGTAGAAVDFASQRGSPPASTPRTSAQTRVNSASRATGEIGGVRGNLLRARVAWGDAKDAASELGERLFKVAKPADDFLFRQSTQGGIASGIGDAVGKLPPKVRGAAIVGSAALGAGLVGANLYNQYQNRPQASVPGLPPGTTWDVLQPKPSGSTPKQQNAQRNLEHYIDQRIDQVGGAPGFDFDHPDWQHRLKERRYLETLAQSRLEGKREAERFGGSNQRGLAQMPNVSRRDQTRLADMQYAESQPGESWESGESGRRSKDKSKQQAAQMAAATQRYGIDKRAETERLRDATARHNRSSQDAVALRGVNVGLRAAEIKADADVQTQQSQSSATRYQARIRAQADVLGKQIQGSTARYQADQTLRGIGVRAQADVLGKQIQGSTARYQADQNLRGVGIRAQADVLGKQIQGSTARYQADQTLRGVETKAQYDYRAKSETSQNQLAGVRSQSFAAIAAAQAQSAAKIHAEALKRRDPELDSISTVEEYEDYKRRKKLARAKADLSF